MGAQRGARGSHPKAEASVPHAVTDGAGLTWTGVCLVRLAGESAPVLSTREEGKKIHFLDLVASERGPEQPVDISVGLFFFFFFWR